MNLDLMRMSQMIISTTDESYLVDIDLETVGQRACLSVGKLENSNFDLDVKKCYARVPNGSVRSQHSRGEKPIHHIPVEKY